MVTAELGWTAELAQSSDQMLGSFYSTNCTIDYVVGNMFSEEKNPKTDGKRGITKYGENVSICQNISIPSLNFCANK